MQTIFEKIGCLHSGETLLLEKGAVYHAFQDDSYDLTGYFFSNTAEQCENPDGRHRVAIFLKDKKDIVIDGNGATLLIHGKMTPFLFDGCENITLKNLTIDYARPTMNEIFVAKKEKDGYILHIPDENPYRVENGVLIWQGEIDKRGGLYWENSYKNNQTITMYHNPATLETYFSAREEGDKFPSIPAFERIEEREKGTLFVVCKDKNAVLPVGCVIQTRNVVRDETGGFIQLCKNVRLENLRVCAMHGLGILAQFSENLHYKGLNCTPKSGRTIVSLADFFHFSGCSGDICIEECVAGGAQDDFINVHGTHLQIVAQDCKQRSLILQFMQSQTWGFVPFYVGDEVEFIKGKRLTPYFSAVVKAVEMLDCKRVKVVLDRDLPTAELCVDSVENVTKTASLTVRNNRFLATAGRGILATTRKPVLIENNYFEKVSGTPLEISSDCNFWFESGYTREVIFRNNRIVDCAYRYEEKKKPIIAVIPMVMDENAIEPVHGRLVVEGNEFIQTTGAGYSLRLEYIQKAEIKNNRFNRAYEVAQKCVNEVLEENNQII